MKELLFLAVLVAGAAAVPARAANTTALDTEDKRIEIILNRFSAPYDPRLDVAELRLLEPNRHDIDLAATDLELLGRQWEEGTAFLEDRRLNR